MIELNFLASEIEKELNELSKLFNVKFKIHSSVGDYKKAQLIQENGQLQSFVNGVLRRLDGTYAVLSDIQDLFTDYSLEFAVKQEYKDFMEVIFMEWVELRIGKPRTIESEDINYILTPSPAIGGLASERGILGSMLPYTINFRVQSIKNGLLTNMIKWSINGEAVSRERASFSTTREPNTKAIVNETLTITTNAYATNTVIMTIPFVKSTKVLDKLEEDILLGRKDEKYTLKREYGTKTYEDVFVLAQGSINEEDGRVVGMSLTFIKTK